MSARKITLEFNDKIVRQLLIATMVWAVVGMLWFICFFNYADRQAISSVLPVLEEEYGFEFLPEEMDQAKSVGSLALVVSAKRGV